MLAPINSAGGALSRALLDAGHFPLLGLVTVATFMGLRPSGLGERAQLARAGAVGAISAGLIELVQPLVSRTASIGDMVNGLLGVAAALVCIAAWPKRRTVWAWVVCGVFVVGGLGVSLRHAYAEWQVSRWQVRSFPLLAGFEREFEARLWHPHGDGAQSPTLSLSSEQASQGARSLRVQTPGNSWNSVGYSVGQRDWSAAKAFAIDVHAAPGLARIQLKLTDTRGAQLDRWMALRPGWNRLRLSRDELGQPTADGHVVRLRSIRYVTLSTPHDDPARLYYVDNVRVIE